MITIYQAELERVGNRYYTRKKYQKLHTFWRLSFFPVLSTLSTFDNGFSLAEYTVIRKYNFPELQFHFSKFKVTSQWLTRR
jgi:hypothetical protein